MNQKNTFGIGMAFCLALGLTACGSTAATTQTVTLAAVGTSAQMGSAILLDTGNNTTSVTISTKGGTDTGTQLAHIHTGTCGSNGPIFTALASVQGGGSQMTVPYSLSALTGGKYYINVHNSTTPATIQACGQIQ